MMRIGHQIWIVLFFSLALVLSTNSFSQSLPAGDVAPYGTGGDGVLNTADYLVLQRIISGDLPMPTGIDLLVADVAPFGGPGPDGVLNTGDLLVLLRAIMGEITLPDIQTGPIDLSGPISQNTTLTQGTTYNVTSTVTVDPGVTLTIEMGARLEFAGNYKLQVNGTLVVNGLPGNEVVFTSANASPARGDWTGIVIGSTSTGTVIDHAEIRWAARAVEVTGSTTATVSNSDIREFSEYGIYYHTGASGSISGNTIDNVNDVGQGIRLTSTVAVTVDANVVSNTEYGVVVGGSSSPVVVSGNTLQDNGNSGVHVSGTADPQVTGNTIINNAYGVRADAGYSNATPAPVVTGNDIYGNTSYDYYAERFGTAVNETITLDATGNWWGTADLQAIAVQVYDFRDNGAYSPFVDYSGFLDGSGGTVVPGNQLVGVLGADTTLAAGTVHTVLGTVRVPAGVTLTVEAGAQLQFVDGTRLWVDGTLLVNGTQVAPAVFTSLDAVTPARGDWVGIYVTGSSTGTVIDHAEIRWATHGVEVTGSTTATVSNSDIREFSVYGIYTHTGAGGSVSGNTIDNVNDVGQGIRLENTVAVTVDANVVSNAQYGLVVTGTSSPVVVSGNTFQDNGNGVYVGGTADPQVTGNTIINNAYGVRADAGYSNATPAPVVTGNDIYGNTSYDYYAERFGTAVNETITLDATGNWWGTADLQAIAVQVYDFRDNGAYSPFVDYSGFLDGSGGTVVPGNQLVGVLGADTTLAAGTVHTVLGTVRVPAGVTLTVEAGAQLQFVDGTRLWVDGTLLVNGTQVAPAVFTSLDAVTPARGDWVGIYVTGSSTGTVIDHAEIRWATHGVEVTGSTTATVSNSDIREFSVYGIYYHTGAGGSISGNTIDNVNDVGQGIRLKNTVAVTVDANVVSNAQYGLVVTGTSSPVVVSGNTFQDNGNGVYVGGTADPQVTGNTIINNAYGVRADAGYSNATPAPVVTGNDIYGNTSYDYYAERFGTAVNETITLDATGNWWGTADLQAIAVQVYEYNDNTTYSPHVDYSSHLPGPVQGPGVMSVTISELYFSPNNDTIKDTTQLQATLSETADWTVTVEQSGVVYRSYSGTGNSISITWDGNDDTAQQVAEGAYRFYIGATASTRTSLPISTNHVTLDITAPIADIDDAYNGTILQNQLIAAVPGTANDATFADYQVEYGAGATPAAWLPINGTLTIPVNNSTLDNWTVGTDDGTPPIANGLYTLRLTVNDKAGNTSSDTSQVTIDNLAAYSVTENIPGFSPALGESMQIDFTLNLPADVTLNVYSEVDGSLVYTGIQSLLAGPNSLVWDGTDTPGALVAGGGYYYTLTASDGTRIGNYTPAYSPTTTDLFLGSGGSQGFNTFKNDFFNRAATAPSNGRAQAQAGTCDITLCRLRLFTRTVTALPWRRARTGSSSGTVVFRGLRISISGHLPRFCILRPLDRIMSWSIAQRRSSRGPMPLDLRRPTWRSRPIRISFT